MDIYTSLLKYMHVQFPNEIDLLQGHARNLQVILNYILPKLIEDNITLDDIQDPIVTTMEGMVKLAHMSFPGGDPTLTNAVRVVRRLLNIYCNRPLENFSFELRHMDINMFLVGYLIRPFSKKAYHKSKQLELDYLLNELEVITGVITNRDFKSEATQLKVTFVSSYQSQRDRMLKTILCLN